jgi:hypothetical protein
MKLTGKDSAAWATLARGIRDFKAGPLTRICFTTFAATWLPFLDHTFHLHHVFTLPSGDDSM